MNDEVTSESIAAIVDQAVKDDMFDTVAQAEGMHRFLKENQAEILGKMHDDAAKSSMMLMYKITDVYAKYIDTMQQRLNNAQDSYIKMAENR